MDRSLVCMHALNNRGFSSYYTMASTKNTELHVHVHVYMQA